jgi:hypothetical protein
VAIEVSNSETGKGLRDRSDACIDDMWDARSVLNTNGIAVLKGEVTGVRDCWF